MVRRIVMFEVSDGTRFDTEEAAERYERLVEDCKLADAVLAPRLPSYGNDGYVQQSERDVLACKRLLLAAARSMTGNAGFFPEDPSKVHNRGIVGRYLDDDPRLRPVRKVWFRIMSTDDRHREWSQPFYAIHPDKGVHRCLNEET